MRRRNLCPGFGLPVAASHQVRPSSPSSRSFPLFFFLFWPSKMENSYCAAASGRGGAETRRGTRRPPNPKRRSPSSRSSPLFSFSILAVENGEIQSSCVVGERRSQSSFVVGSSRKKKTSQPKTTSFWVGLIFFLNQNTPKRRCFGVTVFLKSKHPKRRCFEVFYFFFF